MTLRLPDLPARPAARPAAGADARADAGGRRVLVVQGEYHVTREPDVVLTTLLGSCVAACLRDPSTGLGGMNHFLLPGEGASGGSLRYGAHAMELLVNGVLRDGGRRERLEAKLFGGARMLDGLTDVGEQNAEFAERYLRREGIAYVGGSLRGSRGRRVQFWPVQGRARQLVIEDGTELFAAERRQAAARVVHPASGQGEVELF